MKIAIINASSYYLNSGGQILISADEMKSLNQWLAIFDDVTLMKPKRLELTNDVNDWVPVPENVKVKRLCDENMGIRQKYSEIKIVAQNAIEYDMFYYRLPSYECLFFWLNQKRSIPYFIELHGDMESAVMAGNKPYLIKKPFSLLMLNYFRKMSSNAKFALSIGPVLLEKYVKSNIPMYVTTNHLLLEKDYPNEIKVKEIGETLNLLFVGHIHNRKGLTYLFEALNMLHSNGRKFVMRIAGNGELRSQLEIYAKNHGFNDNVIFLGQIKHGPALFDLYKQADIFILPSIAAEGVPRVTHEAMAFGCPVIATDIGSISWQLQYGSGLIIPSCSAQAIFQAIMDVSSNDDLRSKMINLGYEKSKNFSFERQAEGIKSFVTSQLNLS